MLALQSITLRGFVLVTHMRMHILASVILIYCAIGVFALNNIEFDLWTLLLFGILGYVLKSLGFPVVPIILGVVLGRLAEDSLSRVVALSYDPMAFLSRPWSLFFIMLAVMSMIFPLYQKQEGKAAWTQYFVPCFLIALALPMYMMNGYVRPGIAVIMLALGLGLMVKRYRNSDGKKTNAAKS
jgi:putative tricarboxylic transport membrane protein